MNICRPTYSFYNWKNRKWKGPVDTVDGARAKSTAMEMGAAGHSRHSESVLKSINKTELITKKQQERRLPALCIFCYFMQFYRQDWWVPQTRFIENHCSKLNVKFLNQSTVNSDEGLLKAYQASSNEFFTDSFWRILTDFRYFEVKTWQNAYL